MDHGANQLAVIPILLADLRGGTALVTGATLAIAATLDLCCWTEALPARLALAYPFTHRTFVWAAESEECLRSRS